MGKNLYLAHSLLRFIGSSGTSCLFTPHEHYAPTEWEFCTLQDLDRGASLLKQGMDANQVDRTLWDLACEEQDLSGTRFYRNFYCCKACVLDILTTHINEKHLASSMLTTAYTHKHALLLLSDRATMLPLIVANIPLAIRAKDIQRLLQVKIPTT